MWSVTLTKTAGKQLKSLPKKIGKITKFLIKDIELRGPSISDWPNYGRLKGKSRDIRHCHLKKGNPTYVAMWEVVNKKIKIVEIYYVGTHEKAPY